MSAPPRPGGSVWAALLLIGDELLSGSTRDVHLFEFAARLAPLGVRVGEARVVSDEPPRIAEAVRALSAEWRYLLTTGGIGPTHDDRTVESVALAFGVPLVEHPDAVAAFEAHYGPGGITPERRRMALGPRGCEMIACPGTHSPVVRMGNVFVLAGLPHVARAQLAAVLPLLETGAPLRVEERDLPVAESLVAGALRELDRACPSVEVGSYPSRPEGGAYRTRVVLRGTDEAAIAEAARRLDALAAEVEGGGPPGGQAPGGAPGGIKGRRAPGG